MGILAAIETPIRRSKVDMIDDVMQKVCDAAAQAVNNYAHSSGEDPGSNMPEYFLPAAVVLAVELGSSRVDIVSFNGGNERPKHDQDFLALVEWKTLGYGHGRPRKASENTAARRHLPIRSHAVKLSGPVPRHAERSKTNLG